MIDDSTCADETAPAPLSSYALYRYWDASDRLLYIGISGDLAVRDASHISRSRWMQLTARSAVERRETLAEVKAAERTAIENEHPLFNLQYNNTPEARERLWAYLEEIGRLDLLRPNASTPVPERVAESAPEPRGQDFEPIAGNYTDADEDAYVNRWERMAARAWWHPWWDAQDPRVAEDMLTLFCPECTISEAIGDGLRARKEGRDYPMGWVTTLPVWDETPTTYERYAWSVHADFTYSEDPATAGLSPKELALQREFAEALIAAGRCASARLGNQVVLVGFSDKTEAQFAGAVIQAGGDLMLKCTARLSREFEVEEPWGVRLDAMTARVADHPDREHLLGAIEALIARSASRSAREDRYR